MELEIRGRNLELNESARDYIGKKIDRLARHLPDITTATVDLSGVNARDQASRVVVQVTLNMDGTVLRGEDTGATATTAVDSAMKVMDRRVERYKGNAYKSIQSRRRDGGSIRTAGVPSEESAPGTPEDIEEGKAVWVKQFQVKPMTLEEAASNMELLGHNFFLFLNAESGDHNVLYQHRDGNYGLIQPEAL